MPTYEYVCKNCGETIEVFQSFSDKPLKKHEECGGALQKVFHARGIVFKGGGFYATDSKPSSASKNDSKSGSSSEAKSGSDSSKSDSSKSSTKSGKSAEKAKATTPSSGSDGD